MIFQLLNGTQYDISNYSLKRLFHRIPSIELSHTLESVDGRDGNLILGTQFSGRTISVEFVYLARDIYDYYLLRDELNGLFARKEAFYIIFKREPYKRWKVRLAQGFNIEPNPRMQSFTVDFLCENIFAESVADTSTVKEWDVDKWGWNMGLDWDEDLTYTFNTSSFTIKNLGNVHIDPREHDLEIVVKGTFASSVKITNQTTGDVYQFNKPLASTDTLKITGIRTLLNNLSSFKETNRQLLSLSPGNNQITVEGGTVSSIAFNFRFLYK